jgi:hypothetical protein
MFCFILFLYISFISTLSSDDALSRRPLPSTLHLSHFTLKLHSFQSLIFWKAVRGLLFKLKTVCFMHSYFLHPTVIYWSDQESPLLGQYFFLFPWVSLIFITLSRETNVCVTTLDNPRPFLSSCRGRIFAEHKFWSLFFFLGNQSLRNTTRDTVLRCCPFSLYSHSSLLLTPDHSLGYCLILLFAFHVCVVFVFESMCYLIYVWKMQRMRNYLWCW